MKINIVVDNLQKNSWTLSSSKTAVMTARLTYVYLDFLGFDDV